MEFLRRNAGLINMAMFAVLLAVTVPTMLSAGPQLKALTTQVKELRELAGLQGGYQREAVRYASGVLNTIETLRGKGVEVMTKGIGGKAEPLEEWLVGARREALVLVFTTKSPQAFLRELCQSMALNRPFHLRFPDGKTEKLEDWLRREHPATAVLPEDA